MLYICNYTFTEVQDLVENVVSVAKTAKLYDTLIVLSTVNVKNKINKPMIQQLQEVLTNVETYDRTSINAWDRIRNF